MVVLATGLSVLAAFLALVIPVWSAHRTRHHKAAQADTEAAYRAAVKLMKDPRTPGEVTSFICRFAGLMQTPAVSRALVWDVITGAFWKSTQSANAKRDVDFDALPPEVLQEINQFLVHILLASASRDPVLAWLTRRIILFGLTGRNQDDVRDSRAVIVDLSKQFRSKSYGGLAPAKA